MSAKYEFPLVFENLRSILKPYAKKLTIKTDIPDHYYLDAAYGEKWKKGTFLCGSAGQKELCLVLSHAGLYVPRFVEEDLT